MSHENDWYLKYLKSGEPIQFVDQPEYERSKHVSFMELAASAHRTMDVLYHDLLNNDFAFRMTPEQTKAYIAGARVVNTCYEISQAAEKMLETDPTLATPSVVRWLLEEIENLRCRAPWE